MKNNYIDGAQLLETLSKYLVDTDIRVTEIFSRISDSIIESRLSKNMNQKQFAEYMGVSQGLVSKWENEYYNFTIKSLVEIFDKLDKDFDISINSNQESILSPKIVRGSNRNENNFDGYVCMAQEWESSPNIIDFNAYKEASNA